MPHANPRLSVVLTPSLHATLVQLGQASEQSASSIVRDLLLQTEPALRRMLRLVQAAKDAREQIGSGVGASVLRVVSELEREVEHISDGLVQYQDLVDQAEGVSGRGRRQAGRGAARQPPAAASTPGPVTRGSGTGKTPKRTRRTGGQV